MDPRAELRKTRYGRLPYRSGKLCPTCGCRAIAETTQQAWTYYRFECGAPTYKQLRTTEAIERLLAVDRKTHQAKEGC